MRLFGETSEKRNTPGLWPSANCPEFLQALYQFAPRKTKVSIPPHTTEEANITGGKGSQVISLLLSAVYEKFIGT